MVTDFPFTTDGCSGPRCLWRLCNRLLFGRIGDQPPFEWACELHDVSYFFGGTLEEKQRADATLRRRVEAVLRHSGHRGIARPFAWATERGVAMFGGPERETSYRWTYGFKFERRRLYQALLLNEAVAREVLMAERYRMARAAIARTGGDPCT